MNVMDVTPEEIASLPESEFESNLSEFQKGIPPSDEELRDEFTTRMCVMEFSEEQTNEILKSIEEKVDLATILEYMHPEISATEMAKNREAFHNK